MDLAKLRTPIAAIYEGVWYDYEDRKQCDPMDRPHATHLCFRVKTPGPEFARGFGEMVTAARRDLRPGDHLSDIDANRVQGEALGRYLVTGWANLESGGKPLQWSKDAAASIFGNPEYHFLRAFVEWAAQQEARVAVAAEADAAGNSLGACGGSGASTTTQPAISGA